MAATFFLCCLTLITNIEHPSSPLESTTPEFSLSAASSEIHARFHSGELALDLAAVLANGEVQSSISVAEGPNLTALVVEHTELAFAERLEARINRAAWRTHAVLTSQGWTTAEDKRRLLNAYDLMARSTYEQTHGVEPVQLRYSLSYHYSIMSTAWRLIENRDGWPNDKACNAAIGYIEQGHPFACAEDISLPDTEPDALLPCFFLGGGDICCCGNYDGPCWFCSALCCLHDIYCWCCDHWGCGSACVPEPGCNGAGVTAGAEPGNNADDLAPKTSF